MSCKTACPYLVLYKQKGEKMKTFKVRVGKAIYRLNAKQYSEAHRVYTIWFYYRLRHPKCAFIPSMMGGPRLRIKRCFKDWHQVIRAIKRNEDVIEPYVPNKAELRMEKRFERED